MMQQRGILQIFMFLLCVGGTAHAFTVSGDKHLLDSSRLGTIHQTKSVDRKVSTDLPPVLQQIADERRDFNLMLGKAMDTLRKDMPDILHTTPDFSIYADNIEVSDQSGVRLEGLSKYKNAVSFFQTFVKFWFHSRSGLQFRMVYDFARSSIRVSWNAMLVPKFLGQPVYVDGISIYKLDSSSGKILEHRFENVVINNAAVSPPYGVASLMQYDLMGDGGARIPVGAGV